MCTACLRICTVPLFDQCVQLTSSIFFYLFIRYQAAAGATVTLFDSSTIPGIGATDAVSPTLLGMSISGKGYYNGAVNACVGAGAATCFPLSYNLPSLFLAETDFLYSKYFTSLPPPPPPFPHPLSSLFFYVCSFSPLGHIMPFCGRRYYQSKPSVSTRISRFILLKPLDKSDCFTCSLVQPLRSSLCAHQTPSSRSPLTYFRYVTPFAGVTAKGITASMQDTVIAWRRFDDPWEWGSDVKLNWAVATGASNVTLSCAVWAKVTPM